MPCTWPEIVISRADSRQRDDFKDVVALVPLRISNQIAPSYGSGDPAQRRALHYYHTTALIDLSGLIPVGFWDRVVPERCQSERVVRHAVTALSQAHRDFVVQGSSPPRAQRHLLPSTQGLEAYSKASKALRRYIEGEKALSREAVLTCCLIFNAIEKIHGRPDAAIVHVDNGIAILNAWQRESNRPRLGDHDHLNEIMILFGRLDVGASIANNKREPKLAAGFSETVIGRETRDPTERAVNLRDVRRNYTRRIPFGVDLWRLIVASAPYRHAQPSDVPENLLQAKKELELDQDDIHGELEDLLRQYDASKDSLNALPKSEQHTILTILRVSQLHSLINMKLLREMLPDPAQPARVRPWDDQPEVFLELARTVVDRRQQWKESQLLDLSPNFSPEVAITGGLLFLAHRTTSPQVRAEAAELAFRSAKHEGLVDATSALISRLDTHQPIMLFETPGH